MDATNSFILAGIFTADGRSHTRRLLAPRDSFTKLLPLIDELLKESGITQPDWIATTRGPGSFTGTRITVAVARNLAQLWNIPVLGVDSLAFYGYSIMKRLNVSAHNHLAVLLDAKQKKAYARILPRECPPEQYDTTSILDIKPLDILEQLDENDPIYCDDPEILISYAKSEDMDGSVILSNRMKPMPDFEPDDLFEYALLINKTRELTNWKELLPLYARSDPAHAKYPEGFNRNL